MISGDQNKQSFFFICITSHPALIKICAPVLVLVGFARFNSVSDVVGYIQQPMMKR